MKFKVGEKARLISVPNNPWSDAEVEIVAAYNEGTSTYELFKQTCYDFKVLDENLPPGDLDDVDTNWMGLAYEHELIKE